MPYIYTHNGVSSSSEQTVRHTCFNWIDSTVRFNSTELILLLRRTKHLPQIRFSSSNWFAPNQHITLHWSITFQSNQYSFLISEPQMMLIFHCFRITQWVRSIFQTDVIKNNVVVKITMIGYFRWHFFPEKQIIIKKSFSRKKSPWKLDRRRF